MCLGTQNEPSVVLWKETVEIQWGYEVQNDLFNALPRNAFNSVAYYLICNMRFRLAIDYPLFLFAKFGDEEGLKLFLGETYA